MSAAARRQPLMATATIALPTRTPPPAPIRRAWRDLVVWLAFHAVGGVQID